MFAPYNQSPAGPSQQPYSNQQQQQQQPQGGGAGGGFNNNNGAYNWQQQSTSQQQPAYGQQGGFNQSQGTWQMNGMQQQQQQPWVNNSHGPSGFSNSGMFGNLQQNGPGLSSPAGEKRIFLPGYLNSPATSSPQPASTSRPSTFGSPAQQRDTSGADDSMDRDRSSPPVGRGSVFGSASKKTNTRRNQNTTIFGASSRATQDEDAPPIDSLHDMDDDPSPSHAAPSNAVATQEAETPSQPTEVASQSHGLIIFGFLPDQLASILDHFRNIGPISKIEPSSSNWATIYYAQPWHAARAVRKNGQVVQGCMIGVKWANENGPELPASTPTTQQQSNSGGNIPILEGQARKTATPSSASWFGIGALTGSAQNTPVKSNAFVSAPSSKPQDRNGMFAKVSDLVFGL